MHGILVQLPLPEGLDAEPVLDLIPPEKDVDGLTERSMGRLVRGRDGHVPCTPLGVMRLMERYGVETSGKRAVVIGRSTLVGLPQVLLLGRKGCDATPTLAHSRSGDLAAICREADIIVAAVGVAGLVTAEFVKPGAAVLDVGISRTADGIQGDVDFDAVESIAGAVTPDAWRHRTDDHWLPDGEHLQRRPHAWRPHRLSTPASAFRCRFVSWARVRSWRRCLRFEERCRIEAWAPHSSTSEA